jgi:ribosome-associated protein
MNEKTNQLKTATSEVLAKEAVKLLIEKKAQNVKLYSVSEKTSVTDFYVNATGRSSTHVGALGDEISDQISDRGRDALRVEGRSGNSWILIDYGDVIINIFDRPSRDFYDFDRLLPPETELNIDALVEEVDEKFKLK